MNYQSIFTSKSNSIFLQLKDTAVSLHTVNLRLNLNLMFFLIQSKSKSLKENFLCL